jgi:hypothetical protein
MIRRIACISLFPILVWSSAVGANESLRDRFQSEPNGNKFTSSETTFDLFASEKVQNNEGFFEGNLGIGVGVNRFFTPNFGVGLDTRLEKLDWPNQLNVSLLGRYPIEKWGIAPYGMLGFGRQFLDNHQWMFHFGGGVDYRLNTRTGLFADVRWNMPEESRDFALWRFGLRLQF